MVQTGSFTGQSHSGLSYESSKPMEERLKRTFQRLTLVASLVCSFFLIAAGIRENRPEWLRHQKRYLEIISQNFSDQRFAPASRQDRPQIRQIHLDSLQRTDRCLSCHFGVSDTRMQSQSLPLRAHSPGILENHPVSKFGCTICHAGQGQAVDMKNAHARSPDVGWAFPLLSLNMMESSCGKCHLAIFDKAKNLAGTQTFQKGLGIFQQEGCLGCHKARGVGGTIGPDLTIQGEKTQHEYDFSRVAGERTVINWLFNHFKDPEMVSPGSQMLAVDLGEDEIRALITFTLGMARPQIPFDYFSLDTLKEFKGSRNILTGAAAYPMICSACHGKSGEGKSFKAYKTGIPSLGNQDFLSVASLDFIVFSITHGRSGRQMAAWLPRFSGLRAQEIANVAQHVKAGYRIRSEFKTVLNLRGNPLEGKKLYLDHCSVCHGPDGKGAGVITLSNPDMLAAASDLFLYTTIINGRSNTAMPSWGRFSSDQISHILSFLRSWATSPPPPRTLTTARGDALLGQERYHYLCSRCHGIYGQGDTGPAILNPDFLRSASDIFLATMITYGRQGTAMFGWATAVSQKERLSTEDVANVIAYLRKAAADPPEVIYAGAGFGSSDRGRSLFLLHCAECHGTNGEGTKAPALNNQELLNAATNGYFFATISLGRSGTDMPVWGKGSDKVPALDSQTRHDIVAFVRAWQRIVIKKSSKF